MEYTINLNEQQVELLKSILDKLGPKQLIVPTVAKPKKLSKMDQAIQDRREYRANKEARKRK
jgi:hypothetical protein